MSCMVSSDDYVFIAHLEDLAERAVRSCTGCYTRFLDERQVFAANKAFSGRSDINVRFWGGYKEAQRKLCCIYPDWMEFDENNVPIVCLTYNYGNMVRLTHRDFLGAFMSCGIQRETIGDIIVGDRKTQAFVTETVVPILIQLTKIGSCGVKATDVKSFDMPLQQNFREISGTVQSLRIDSVAALAIKESREKAVKILKQRRIEINYEEVTSSSLLIEEGDIFVVRGYGKFRLKMVTGLSKKGRLHILIEQYH